MSKVSIVAERLRAQIIGGLHVGRLQPGSRLPSIREVAEREGLDHRLAARAYEQLEQERIVEVRGRSGVFVAAAPSSQHAVLEGRQHWVADVLRQAWSRRISFAEVQQLTTRAALHGLRCLCIESTDDHLVAFSSELASDFGFTIVPILCRPSGHGGLTASDIERIAQGLGHADVVATTAFHAPAIRQHVDLGGRPLVSMVVNPALTAEIARVIRTPVVVVVADANFIARARHFMQDTRDLANVTFVLVSDFRAEAADTPTLFTRAARRALKLSEHHLLTADVPFIAPETAADLCETIVRLSAQPR